MMADDIKTEAQVTYKPYPAYKDSGVEWLGDIPEGWATVRFKSLFQIRKRIAGMLGFDILSITQQGIRVKDTKSGDGQLSMDYSKYQHVNVGDFAMNHMDLLTGFVDISGFDGVTSPDYRVFTLENNQASDSYYLYVLQFCYIAKIFFPLGQGAAHIGRWRLPTEAFNEFLAAFPPPDEQAKIAAFLDYETVRIDALIEKQERLIELLEEKRQAVISHAVTKGLDPNAPMRPSGIDWLGDVPTHWEVKKLKHFIKSLNSGVSVNAADTPAQGDAFGVLKTSCVYSGIFRPQENKTVLPEERSRVKCRVEIGSIIVSRMNTPELVGASAFVEESAANLYLPDRLWQIEFFNKDKLDAQYLSSFMKFGGFRQQISLSAEGASSSMQSISKEDYLAIQVAYPPKEEQVEIRCFLSDSSQRFNTLKDKAKAAIDLLKDRRTALIAEAVTGKIDLRDWQPPEENAAVGA